jgi:hypothetical protein
VDCCTIDFEIPVRTQIAAGIDVHARIFHSRLIRRVSPGLTADRGNHTPA